MALIFLKKKDFSLIRGVHDDKEWTSWVGAITLVGEGGGFIHKQREVAVSPIQGPVSFCKPTGQRGFDKNKTNKAFIGLHKNISRCSNQIGSFLRGSLIGTPDEQRPFDLPR